LFTNLGLALKTDLKLAAGALELSQRKWKFRTDPETEGVKAGWADPDYDDAQWRELMTGKSWETQGVTEENPAAAIKYPNTSYNGVGWYRIRLTIPETCAGRPLHLIIGSIRGADEVFFNGRTIGKTVETGGWDDIFWCAARDYPIPADAIRAGDNVVAVRVDGQRGPNGITGWPVRIMAVDSPNETVLAPMDKDQYLYDPYRFVQW